MEVELTIEERRAILGFLVRMAEVDGDLAASEVGLIRKVHRAYFGDVAPIEEMKVRLPDPDAAVAALRRPEARSALIRLLYEMIQVDGLELDRELAFYAESARRIGLDDDQVREVWRDAAFEIYDRACRALAQRRLDALSRELGKLRGSLFLGPEADARGERILQELARGFRVDARKAP